VRPEIAPLTEEDGGYIVSEKHLKSRFCPTMVTKMGKKAVFPLSERTLKKRLELSYFTFQGLLRNIALEDWLYECFAKELIDNALDADPTHIGIEAVVSEAAKSGVKSLTLRVESDGRPFLNFPDVLSRFDVQAGTKFLKKPTRGILGNALRVLAGAPYALAEELGRSVPSAPLVVETGDRVYHFGARVDPVKGTVSPRLIAEKRTPSPNTAVSLTVPYDSTLDPSGSLMENLRAFSQIYALFNPGIGLNFEGSGDHYPQKKASFEKGERPESYTGLTSIHWHSLGDFSGIIRSAASSEKREPLSSLLNSLRGFTSRERQQLILSKMRSRTIQEVARSPAQIKRLFALLGKYSKPPRAELLGRLGKKNLRKRLQEICDVNVRDFHYGITHDVHKESDFEIPFVIEAAFCRVPVLEKRVTWFGINSSPYLGDPLLEAQHVEWTSDRGRRSQAYTLREMLDRFDAKSGEPVILAVHIICPNLKVRDAAKFRFDFEPLRKPLAQLVYDVIKTYPQVRLPKRKRSQARSLILEELLRRKKILDEAGEIPPEEWTTQQGLFYKMRSLMGGDVGIRRRSFISAIVDECRQLGAGDLSIRERLGIKAAVRAQLFFRGSEDAVSFEQVQRLAEKGSDLLLCEKEGVAEILEPYARQRGVAIVNSRGFATDYVRQLLAMAKESRGNIFLLTDLDASGLLLAKKLEGFSRIGVDSEMLDFLEEKGYLSNRDDLWEAYDTKGGKAPRKHLEKLSPQEQVLVRNQRLEIDSLMASVGSDHLWEAILARMNEMESRDLTRSLSLTASSAQVIPKRLARTLEKIRAYLSERAEKPLENKLKPYENWTAQIPENIEEEEAKVQNAVRATLSKDRRLQRMTRRLEQLTNGLTDRRRK
jgi:hypothetical protein